MKRNWDTPAIPDLDRHDTSRSSADIETKERPILYDHTGTPITIHRPIGFTVKTDRKIR